MAVYAGQYFPSGGEAGFGGGILQVKSAFRTGAISYSISSASDYKNLLVCAITPTRSDSKILILISAHGSSSYWGGTCCGAWQGFLMRN